MQHVLSHFITTIIANRTRMAPCIFCSGDCVGVSAVVIVITSSTGVPDTHNSTHAHSVAARNNVSIVLEEI